MPRHSPVNGEPEEVTMERIRARKSAEEHWEMLLAEGDSFQTEESMKRFWTILHDKIGEHLGLTIVKPVPVKGDKPVTSTKPACLNSGGWEDALRLCDEILSNIDLLPDRAQEFGESVGDKIRSISATIEEMEHVTSNQWNAIQNMGNGVKRWLNRQLP